MRQRLDRNARGFLAALLATAGLDDGDCRSGECRRLLHGPVVRLPNRFHCSESSHVTYTTGTRRPREPIQELLTARDFSQSSGVPSRPRSRRADAGPRLDRRFQDMLR